MVADIRRAAADAGATIEQMIMAGKSNRLGLPTLVWRRATCEVCGEPFDYLSRKRPHTCKKGDCLYKYEYKISPHTWAGYQPTFFDHCGK